MFARTLFSEEHNIFRESVRRFIEAEVTPHHAQWEEDGVVSREVWAKAGAEGLLLCDMPEEYGGGGGDFLHSLIVMEELIRVQATGPFFGLHSDIVAPYIFKYGTEAQKQAWLPPMARGEVITAIGMTEPGGGSDLQNLRTTAVRDGDDYVINGQKTYISNGQLADLVVVAAKTDLNAGAAGLTLFLVETNRPGFARGRNFHKLGMHAQDTSELFFEDLRVPAASILGAEGKGFIQLVTELAKERLLAAARVTTNAEAAIDWTTAHVQSRVLFGKPLAAMQNTQFKLAEAVTQTSLARVFVDRCIEAYLKGELDPVTAAMAKLSATENHWKVLDECLQLHGGQGYMWETPITRAFGDGRAARITAGSNEVMKTIIARSILK
jgi:acyl-CoA dehydrogenase